MPSWEAMEPGMREASATNRNEKQIVTESLKSDGKVHQSLGNYSGGEANRPKSTDHATLGMIGILFM